MTLYARDSQTNIGRLKATPDTGAEVTLLGTKNLQSLDFDIKDLNPPTNDELIVANECYGRTAEIFVHVCEDLNQFLLAWYTCKELEILPPHYPRPDADWPPTHPTRLLNAVETKNASITISNHPSQDEIEKVKKTLLHEYQDVFSQNNELREMAGKKMKISLKEDAQPFALSAPRQIPYVYRQLVKDELDEQVAAGVIEPVSEATDWLHPLVVVPKPKGGIRLCVDLQKLNKFVKRPFYPTRTPSDAISSIKPESKFFMTLDAFETDLNSNDFAWLHTPGGHIQIAHLVGSNWYGSWALFQQPECCRG